MKCSICGEETKNKEENGLVICDICKKLEEKAIIFYSYKEGMIWNN